MFQVGRCLASWIQMPGSGPCGRTIVVLFSISRVVFIPLFMYCNAAPTQRHLPILFHNDADFIMFMIFFAVSNGYLVSITTSTFKTIVFKSWIVLNLYL